MQRSAVLLCDGTDQRSRDHRRFLDTGTTRCFINHYFHLFVHLTFYRPSVFFTLLLTFLPSGTNQFLLLSIEHNTHTHTWPVLPSISQIQWLGLWFAAVWFLWSHTKYTVTLDIIHTQWMELSTPLRPVPPEGCSMCVWKAVHQFKLWGKERWAGKRCKELWCYVLKRTMRTWCISSLNALAASSLTRIQSSFSETQKLSFTLV